MEGDKVQSRSFCNAKGVSGDRKVVGHGGAYDSEGRDASPRKTRRGTINEDTLSSTSRPLSAIPKKSSPVQLAISPLRNVETEGRRQLELDRECQVECKDVPNQSFAVVRFDHLIGLVHFLLVFRRKRIQSILPRPLESVQQAG